jgi:Zn-dependent M28 family amino/carboxypeptidase
MMKKLATFYITPDMRGTRPASMASPEISWAQFGNEMLLYADEPQWEGFMEHAGRDALQLREKRATVRREHMHVVVQNGRLFQQEHSDVPVILDRGRFLLVELDPDHARQLGEKNETCYGVLPLEENQVVFDVREPTAARATPVAWIQDLVNNVVRSSFEADLRHLASFPTRYSTSAHYTEAATWVRKQLRAMNYKTRLQSITVNGSASKNIVADKTGSTTGARSIVLLTAHLDSINLRGGPAASAPGADDNGSGSAGLLEIARAFRDHRSVHDLRFVHFGGEEQGLFGSKQYVATLLASERARIRAVVNMDMVGSLNSPSRSVLLEGASLSQRVIDGLNEAAATYTQLGVEQSHNPFNSDHVPFINARLPAVLTIEGADNTNSTVHSSNDTIDRIDYDLALEILRMNVAFTGSEVGNAS